MLPFQKKFFPAVYEHSVVGSGGSQTSNTAYCKYDDQILQLFVSSLYLAAAFFAQAANITTRKYGRKVSMLVSGIAFAIGVILMAAAQEIGMLIVGRIFLGVGVGYAIQSVTLYNSEMAPAHLRGALNILFQLCVTIGILVAQLINYGVRDVEAGWRIGLGCAGAPAIIVILGGLILPDTPNSLIERGHIEKGRKVLERIRGTTDVDAEFIDLCDAAEMSRNIQGRPIFNIFKKQYRPQLVFSVLIPFFQQFDGINAIIFYSSQLFDILGSGQQSALLSSVIVGAVNVGSTLVAVFGVDRLGRRFLWIEAGIQMAVTHVLVAILMAVYLQADNVMAHGPAIGIIVILCIFIAGHAWGFGPLGWLIPSEIQPLDTRSAGQSINVTINMLFTFLIGQSFLTMLCSMEWGVYLFFCGWCVIAAVWAMFFMPETKGIPIDEVHLVFRNHWFWGRVTGTAGAPLPKYDANGVEINRASVTRVSLQKRSMNPDAHLSDGGLGQNSMDPKMLANKEVVPGALTGDNHAANDFKVADTK